MCVNFKILNRKPEARGYTELKWMSPGDIFPIDRKTLLEIERVTDEQTGKQTLRPYLNILSMCRKSYRDIDEEIYWGTIKATPVAMELNNGIPTRLFFFIDQCDLEATNLKPVS